MTENMVTGFDNSVEGKQTLTVTYQGLADTFDVYVTVPVMVNDETQRETQPETEMEPPVEISMPEYELCYSGELKDVILVKEVAEFSGLELSVKLSGSEAHIFTLHYNNTEGDFVTVLDDAKGEKVPVAFLMATIPEGLSDADAQTFYRAQEVVNEIAESLVIK